MNNPSDRSRSPLVIAPADALRDGQEILWVVVGPTSDAHFDSGAGAEELTRLLAEKSRRQQEVTRHHEWREALTELRHHLQQFQPSMPRTSMHHWLSAGGLVDGLLFDELLLE